MTIPVFLHVHVKEYTTRNPLRRNIKGMYLQYNVTPVPETDSRSNHCNRNMIPNKLDSIQYPGIVRVGTVITNISIPLK